MTVFVLPTAVSSLQKHEHDQSDTNKTDLSQSQAGIAALSAAINRNELK
jgi:hypothetical protein